MKIEQGDIITVEKLRGKFLVVSKNFFNTTEQAIEENEKKLVTLSETDVPSLKVALRELQGQIEFSKVVLSSEQAAGDKLMLIEGWAPAYSKGEIEAYLNDAHVYYEITDPMPGDNVPIRLNNKGFFAWFEPICKLYMLPKYNELDLTPFFAPFFMIFFGLCLAYIFTFRFFIEFVKQNQEAFEDNMMFNMGQWLSVPFIIIGFYFMFFYDRKKVAKK